MRSTIFIPKKIKVGYQSRQDTYTKKLAFVVHYDEKGKLRQEKSWSEWVSSYKCSSFDYITKNNIPFDDFDNEPTSGFVLNKKAGDHNYGWNSRKAYCRVYDPRGFEIEIGIDNLLYILDHANSIKGKGLEGEFIYGWEGKNIILMPVEAPNYKEIQEYNKKVFKNESFKKKDMDKGRIYVNKQGQRLVFLDHNYEYNIYEPYEKYTTKRYFFHTLEDTYTKNNKTLYIVTNTNLTSIIEKTDEICDFYPDLMDQLESYSNYVPYDPSQFVYKEIQGVKESDIRYYNYYDPIYIKYENEYVEIVLNKSNNVSWYDNSKPSEYGLKDINSNTKYYVKGYKSVNELINNVIFYRQIKYLKNGKQAKK